MDAASAICSFCQDQDCDIVVAWGKGFVCEDCVSHVAHACTAYCNGERSEYDRDDMRCSGCGTLFT